jgi:hypothetical protein
MKTRLLLLATLIFLLPAASNAQLGGLLKKGASKVMNSVGKGAKKEANSEIDSAAQKKGQNMVNNAAEDQNQNSQANQNGNQGRGGIKLGGLLGGKSDIKHNEEYDFDGRIYMQMEMYDKKDVVKSDYFIYFSQKSANAGIEFKTIAKEGEQSQPMSTTMVYDNENRSFMMLIGGTDSRTGIISTIPSDSALKARQTERTGTETTPPTIVKTGNSKVIAGYKCDEYKIVDQQKKGYSLAWMTKDLKINADKRNWNKAGIPTYYGYAGFEQSSMLAMDSYDENNKMTMKMETKEISPNYPHKIVVTGYTLIKMNFNQMQSPGQKK